MGCGASKEQEARSRNVRRAYDTMTDRSSINSRRSMDARERVVYERPDSENGDEAAEPGALANTVSSSFRQMKAKVLDHVHSKNDVETRKDFEEALAAYEPPQKLVDRCQIWMEFVVDEDAGQPSGPIKVLQRDAEGVPIIESYLDKYLATHEEIVEETASLTPSKKGDAASMAANSIFSSVQSLSSQRSGTGGAPMGSSLRRSPQQRGLNINLQPVQQQQAGNGEVDEDSEGSLDSTQSDDMRSSGSSAMHTPRNQEMDDMDALLYGGGDAGPMAAIPEAGDGPGGSSSPEATPPSTKTVARESTSETSDGMTEDSIDAK